MPRFSSVLERVLVALIVAIFFLPLIAALPQIPATYRAVMKGKAPLPPTLAECKNSLSEQVNTGFFGREFLIRWTSELWFRAFHMCAPKSANITVGKGDTLFENLYLQDYCLARVPQSDLEPLVRELKRMQEVCERLGMAFVLVVTPSKAAICSEAIPGEWMARYNPSPRAYDNMIPLLRQHGIRFVDGHQLAEQAKAHAPAPLFPKGGIHWGQYAASLTTEALIAQLRDQGVPLSPIQYRGIQVDTKPGLEERDLMKLMKLAIPWHYPVAKIDIAANPPAEGKRPTMAVIGGSFMWRILQQLVSTQQFSEIDGYFYYKLYKSSNPNIENGFYRNSGINIVRQPTGEMDFQREIYGADCLVLELNEAVMIGANHLKAFLSDALSHVPGDASQRGPFLYESYQPYRWGERLSFLGQPETEWKPSSLTGFGNSDPGGTWTDGPEASIRLDVPRAERDLLLQAEVGAFVVPGKLGEQRVRVYANGNLAGEWQIADKTPAARQLALKKEWIGGGKLVLRFEISHPASPKRLRVGRDARNLGLHFVSLCVSEPHP